MPEWPVSQHVVVDWMFRLQYRLRYMQWSCRHRLCLVRFWHILQWWSLCRNRIFAKLRSLHWK
jgi:hypothetical protein